MRDRHGVAPTEAEEVLDDPDALLRSPDPASKSGKSDRYVGWCSSRGELLVVIVVRHDGRLYGSNAWPANEVHRNLYEGWRTMNEKIPTEAREALLAELDADSPEYRDHVSEGEWTKPNRGPSPLLTLRVPPETLDALQALAASHDVPVSALARGFILDGLAAHQGEDLRLALERLERDLAAVKARALAS